jgi:hypothetical protein
MPCSFGPSVLRWSEACDPPNDLLEVTVTDRQIPLVPAAYGTPVARPARTTRLAPGGDPGRLNGWLSPQEAAGERGDPGLLDCPGLPDGGGPRPHRLGVPGHRADHGAGRGDIEHRHRPGARRGGQARPGRIGPAHPLVRGTNLWTRQAGPAPGATRPGHKRPRWAGRHRPPRGGRAGRRRHPRSAAASRGPAQGGSAQSPAPRRTPASTPARRSGADPGASRWQAAAARSPGRWSSRSWRPGWPQQARGVQVGVSAARCRSLEHPRRHDPSARTGRRSETRSSTPAVDRDLAGRGRLLPASRHQDPTTLWTSTRRTAATFRLARGPGRVDAVVAVVSRLEQVGRVAYVTA